MKIRLKYGCPYEPGILFNFRISPRQKQRRTEVLRKGAKKPEKFAKGGKTALHQSGLVIFLSSVLQAKMNYVLQKALFSFSKIGKTCRRVYPEKWAT